jgi:hypothetical protein
MSDAAVSPPLNAAELAALARSTAHVAGIAQTTLPAQRPPWTASGVRVRAGQAYSVFASGRVLWRAGDPGLHGGPRFHLWVRVTPGGRIRNLREDSDTFIADVDGEIEVALYMGMWADAYGALATSPALYTRLTGGLEAVLVTWRGDAATALDALCAQTGVHGAFAAEARHLRTHPPLPAGWQPLIETGETHLFTPATDESGRACVRIEGSDDQGILCRDCDVPLSRDTQLSWGWRLHVLPSTCAEDTARCHDYVSIATEFDNGRDLTWFWSSALAPGRHFQCPVQAWRARETHFVVRSGQTGLGTWQRESRRVWDDVANAMGTPPRRIVRVWLIAVASFQHGPLRAEFSEIEIDDGRRRHRVL